MWIIDLFVILLGLMFGSFFNVAAMRGLEGGSIVAPSSHCPSCRTPLRWFELIPVLSYIWLGGKCRYCAAPISPLYLFGELATAISFYLIYLFKGWTVETLIGWLLAALLILSVLTDLRGRLILDQFTLPAIGLFLFIRLWSGDQAWWYYLAGGALGFSVLFALALISRGGMGGGDIKLFAAIGAALGPGPVLTSLVLSAFFGVLAGLPLMISGKIKRKQPIPFAPFIWIGTLTAYLFGPLIWHEYMQWIKA
jgi:leader peptidase (prepilin peptidase)/N-methyltransferase